MNVLPSMYYNVPGSLCVFLSVDIMIGHLTECINNICYILALDRREYGQR